MTAMQKLDEVGTHRAVEQKPGATGLDERMAALFRRHGADGEFRDAVDDMTAATGLALSDASLGDELDAVVNLARYKRAHPSTAAPSR